MTNSVYSTHATAVDAVFYPVVPDSFMRNRSNDAKAMASRVAVADWPEEIDRPLVSPHDRWSF